MSFLRFFSLDSLIPYLSFLQNICMRIYTSCICHLYSVFGLTDGCIRASGLQERHKDTASKSVPMVPSVTMDNGKMINRYGTIIKRIKTKVMPITITITIIILKIKGNHLHHHNDKKKQHHRRHNTRYKIKLII